MTNFLHTKRIRNKTLLPFSVIRAASQGDEAAICCILKRYEGLHTPPVYALFLRRDGEPLLLHR